MANDLDRCDREIATIEALPPDTPEALGATIGWLDWAIERQLLEERECAE